jgi:hypothetical protein
MNEFPMRYSTITLHEFYFSIPKPIRRIMFAQAGLNMNYMNTRIFTPRPGGFPAFKVGTAVALDKMSKGTIDFRDLADPAVDWDYVRRALITRRRLTLKADKVAKAAKKE